MGKDLLLDKKEGGRYATKPSRIWGVFFALLLIFIDQLTKLVADTYFNLPASPDKIDVIPGWIALCIRYNDGIAYGVGGDASPAVKLGVIGATGVIMLVLAVLYFCIDHRRTWMRAALVLVVGGGLGNLIDRLYYRVWETDCLFGVRDMVDLSRFGFAVCNFADFFICIGAVVMILALLFFDQDALFPLGKKYKALAKEADEKQKAKDEAKKAKKANNG